MLQLFTVYIPFNKGFTQSSTLFANSSPTEQKYEFIAFENSRFSTISMFLSLRELILVDLLLFLRRSFAIFQVPSHFHYVEIFYRCKTSF